MKNILLLIHDDPGQEARLQAALDITRAVEGHLHCVDVALMPAAVDTPYDGVGVELVLEHERLRETQNKASVQKRLEMENVSWSWADKVGSFDGALQSESGLADLIVVSCELSSTNYPAMRETAEALVLHGHRPIVAMPENARLFDAAGHVLIAWDGSPPANAAMMAAVPLLRHATKVTLLKIGEIDTATPIQQAAAYLSRHGIAAHVVRSADPDHRTGEALLSAIIALLPSYVVMGAYGHSRTMEALFGGTTRTMLKESPVPLFLAH